MYFFSSNSFYFLPILSPMPIQNRTMFMRTYSKFKRDGTALCRGPQGARCVAGGPRCAGGRGPLYSAGGYPPHSGERHAAGDRGPQGAPLYLSGVLSRACDGPNGLVPKTFTLNSAMRAGRQGRGRGPEPATRSPA